MENPWKRMSVKEVYNNAWINVQHHEVIDPSGLPGIYGKVSFKNMAMGIIPLDDYLNSWIVGQYRYPLDSYTWEIPEGGSPLGSDPLEGAKKELQEEVGIIAEQWDLILESQISNSVTDEKSKIYVARELSFGQQSPESTEDLTIRKVPFNTLFEMTMKGEIQDSISVMGILKLKLLLDRNEI